MFAEALLAGRGALLRRGGHGGAVGRLDAAPAAPADPEAAGELRAGTQRGLIERASCGSKIGTRHGTLVHGKQRLKAAVPSGGSHFPNGPRSKMNLVATGLCRTLRRQVVEMSRALRLDKWVRSGQIIVTSDGLGQRYP